MRVLITGVTGQIGSALVKALCSVVQIIGVDRRQIDFAQPERIPESLNRIQPDLIINPAAYTAVDRAEDDRDLAFRVNADAPEVIARWAAPRSVPLIHFSTDYVFDGSGSRPWRESDAPNPLSAYGASKLAGDQAVRAAGGSHLIVRTSWIYAATGSNFLLTIVRLAKERSTLRVVADQVGAPTAARTVAEAVAAIIGGKPALADRLAAANGIVNLAAGGETSWHGFAVAIMKGLKARGVPLAVQEIVPIATKDYPTRAVRPANSRLDLTRLSHVFGTVTPTWEHALPAELDRLAGALVVKTAHLG